MIINQYLKHIQESKVITRNANAPCAAFETVYGKKCPHKRGRYEKPHKQKKWNDIMVDGHLKDKWLNDLSKIKEIEIRSSCEGHESTWVTYIIFRLNDKSKENKPYLN